MKKFLNLIAALTLSACTGMVFPELDGSDVPDAVVVDSTPDSHTEASTGDAAPDAAVVVDSSDADASTDSSDSGDAADVVDVSDSMTNSDADSAVMGNLFYRSVNSEGVGVVAITDGGAPMLERIYPNVSNFAMTVSLHVRFDMTSTNQVLFEVVRDGGAATFQIRRAGEEIATTVSMFRGSSNVATVRASGCGVGWCHIIATVNRETGYLSMFVNGAPTVCSGSVCNRNLTLAPNFGMLTSITIGGSANRMNPGSNLMSQLVILDHVATADERMALANKTFDLNTALVAWRLNDGGNTLRAVGSLAMIADATMTVSSDNNWLIER